MFKKLFLTLFIMVLSTSLLAKQLNSHENHYVYDISYKKIGLGKLELDINWDGQKGVVNSAAKMSLLLISFRGDQLSHLYRDKLSKKILTRNFIRSSHGFSTTKMAAEFSKEGHQVNIITNGKKNRFENKNNQMIDFNAIIMQIGEALKRRETHFDFYMPTSDDVAHYFFKVVGEQIIKTKFGKINTFKVMQTHINDRVLEAWFAPSINYQMVKFRYQRKLLDIRGELVKHSVTPSA